MESATRVLACLGAALLLTGCVVVREGKGVVTGPAGVLHELTWTPGSVVGAEDRIEVGVFADDMFERAPKEFMQALPAAIRARFAHRLTTTKMTGREIRITGSVIHYEAAAGLGDRVLDPFEEAVVRVTLVDVLTGRELGTATCIGRSGANTSSGARKKAEGVAKAILEWISKHSRPSRSSSSDVRDRKSQARRGGRPRTARGGGPPEGTAVFAEFDHDNDGRLTREEVPNQAWSRLSAADADGNGMVTRKEFEEAGVSRRP